MLRVEKKPNISLYTSGACAVAAVKGAADMLINGKEKSEITVTLPACVRVRFRLLDVKMNSDAARCAVAKVWTGVEGIDEALLIYAKATKTKKPRDIVINYKKGIGRYAKKVDSYRRGDAAVTPEVKFLMKNAILDLWEGKKVDYGILIEISCPKGIEAARKTVNEAYGIVGGIALIGSYGVSVKDDNQAKLDKITLNMKKARLGGATKLIFCESNAVDTLADAGIYVDRDKFISYRTYLSDICELAQSMDIDGFLFINNLSAGLPLTGGVDNTTLNIQTSILAAHAAKFGIDAVSAEKMLECRETEAAYEILEKCGIHGEVMDSVVNASKKKLAERFPGAEVEVMIFSKTKGILGRTCAADELLAKINSFELSEVDFGKIYLEEGAREASAGTSGAEE